MAEMQNSRLLDLFIESARKIGEGGTITAEKLMVTVITYVTDPKYKNESKQELTGFLKMAEAAHLDLPRLQRDLLAQIKDHQMSAWDNIYFQTKLMVAKGRAKELGLAEVTADLMLDCLLQEPSAILKQCLSVNKAGGAAPEKVQMIMEEEAAPAKKEEKPAEEPGGSKAAVAATIHRVKEIQKALSEAVFGQDNAVSVFTTGYFQGELLSMTDKKRVRPRATYLFAGPPGVGKTFLAEKAAEILELPFLRADMSEYADNEATIEFCGSDKVYKNGKAGNITGFVEKNPKCVLLFDEIEKAHISVIHLFLQLLDAGRLRDNFTDTEVSFSDAIIIFTTNAGRPLYENSDSGDFSDLSRKVILKALQQDVNPATGAPFFPAAICSRFASGNVVMFNHISAHNLRDIAKREVLRHAGNFEKEIGIQVEIDETVHTALLFAEGGAADARTVRSRAEAFFDDELYELFRLVSTDSVATDVNDIESIRIRVELPEENEELMSLFRHQEKPEVLVFASEQIAESCRAKAGFCNILSAENPEEAAKLLKKEDVQLILLDLLNGEEADGGVLNVEDVRSKARDFFWFVREKFRDLPIYLLETDERVYNSEERISFLRQGVRGVISVATDTFEGDLQEICRKLHQQNSMNNLAKSNKIVTFETAQSLSEGGKCAEIRLFDFALKVALDPGDSENVLSNVSKPNLRFDQVIGAEDAKKELKYFVEYLKNPKKYLRTGVQAPKGVLLYGPPGTGKTLLAKAMASESDVTFITAEGNQFLKKYVGEGPEKVHELFRTARKYAPSILFIDEIDAIAKERRGGDNAGAAEATLTAFLTEMDGFKNDPSKPVFVLAATNFDIEPGREKSLDPALMRRFDRRVYIDLPDRDDRVQYLKLKIAHNPAFEISEAKFDNLAVRSTGMSLAELESVIELALRMSIRDGNQKVTDAILEEAFETFNSGEKKNWDISQLERVARHEAGHAFICWHSGETPSYLTVVARSNHGGYMQHGDNEGKAIYTKDELLARIRTSLGGRAAELVYYGEKDGVSTGPSGDLQSATHLAQQLLCTYGMDEEFGLAVADPRADQSGEIRRAVNRILAAQLEKAVEIISAHKPAIDRLVETVISKNHLTGREIDEILGA
ncbi:MAG: AAA family ATPase [Clostridia bacterium]|nr:AAA family ATPase [Clostridia bacterium]